MNKTTKLIIIDGMDNTGKTTLINRLTSVLQDQLNMKVHTIHLQKPPSEIPEEQIPAYSHNYYTVNLVNTLKSVFNLGEYDYIILDRGWVSEYVYGPMYRNRDPKDIVEDNIVMDYKISNIFGRDNIYLYVLVGTSKFLIAHEDNLSLSQADEKLLIKEYNLFKNAYYMSLLNNKKCIEVDDCQNYREYLYEIFNDIVEF